ncbi:MAG: hypothetical protein ABIN79_06090 [Marmoricola sp.]
MSEPPPDSRPIPHTSDPVPEPTTALPAQGHTDQQAGLSPSRSRRIRDRLWAARVLIGVALASLIVGAVGASAVVAVAGGDEHGGRGGEGGHGWMERGDAPRGDMERGRSQDQRGGGGNFRGQPGAPGDQGVPSAPSTTPTPSTPTPSS